MNAFRTIRKLKRTISMSFLVLFGMACTDTVKAIPPTPPPAKRIKLGLLLDTSSSMSGLINQAQSQLWKIVNELATAKCEGVKPELEIALYEYGNSGLPASEGYIRMVTPLTDDLDQISADLFALTTNGGNEFCGRVIQTATDELDWGAGDEDLKVLFIAGNEPFNQGQVKPSVACRNAINKGIKINTIYCGEFNEGLRSGWKKGADLANGHYMSISHNSKTVYIESPYDNEIDELNTDLNATYIPYGSLGHSKKAMQMSEDANSEKYGKQNKVSRIMSKNSYVYKNTKWDLVDANKEKSFDLTKIKKEQLPKKMQTMTNDQKKAYVAKKTSKRIQINQQIKTLSTKRKMFVAEKKKAAGENEVNSLDVAIIKAIHAQAKTKNFTFEN
tara:strand:- start:2023 stop:3186 length:1164 start_codon:yes stop_codon:yes gene_type:complete